MKTILCIEAGDLGGGSAESLYTHINSLKDKYNFICIFTSNNRFSKRIEQLNIPVHYSLNNLFNIEYIEKNRLRVKLHNILYKLTFKMNRLSIHSYIIYFFNRPFYDLLEDIIQNNIIDLIHTNNNPNRDFLLIKIASKYNKKIVSHIRSYNLYGFSKVKAKFCNKKVKKFITYSDFAKNLWSEDFLEKERIHVVSNAVMELSEKDYIGAHRPINAISQLNCKKIGLIGRIIPERGHLFALKVMRNLKNRGHDFKLFIIGDYRGFENYFEEIVVEIDNLDLKDNVVFTGFVDNPYQYIKNMNILFMPYSIEPFGRTLLESWQLKTPVILSDVGYIRDLVRHNRNGMIFRVDDIESCMDCFEGMFDNRKLMENIVESGYQTYHEKYTPKNYSVKIEALYDSICET